MRHCLSQMQQGLFWCHIGQASDRPGPIHSLFFEAASFRGQRMLPKCAKFLFLTKFLGCTGITLCNTDSCFNAFFSFFFLFYEWSQEKLSCDVFLKNYQTRTISIFLLFCIYLSIFFSLFSHYFLFLLSGQKCLDVARASIISEWLIINEFTHFYSCFKDACCREAIAKVFKHFYS